MAARHPYGRGDVILIQFPFSSATGQKDRPAIVMSTEYTTTAGMNCWSWPSLPDLATFRLRTSTLAIRWTSTTFMDAFPSRHHSSSVGNLQAWQPGLIGSTGS